MSGEGEIEAAKALLRKNGFTVLPREAIKTLGAGKYVDNRDLLTACEHPGMMMAIRRDLFQSIAYEFEKSNDWVAITKTDEPNHFDQTLFSLRLNVIPASWECDPILEMIRERQMIRGCP